MSLDTNHAFRTNLGNKKGYIDPKDRNHRIVSFTSKSVRSPCHTHLCCSSKKFKEEQEMKFLIQILAFSAVVATAIHQEDVHGRRAIAAGSTPTLYKYFTLLSDTASGAGTRRCGGVLIHEDVVASSASCIYEQFVRFNTFPIIARTNYRSDSSSDSTHFVGSINNAPGFSPNSPNLVNDLVLLKLNTTANIPVPMLNQNFLTPTSFVVAGAGPTTTNGPWSTSVLEAEILPQDFNECRNAYKALDARVNLNEDAQFCAGRRPGVAGGPCGMADHGGPVIDTRGGDTNSSNHILMGISSFGNGCGTQDLPYVFTRTRKFYTWMRLEICRLTVSPPLHCFTNVPSVSPSESPSSRPTSTLEQGYFVLLSDVGKGAGSVRCGGVLIHSDVVLTTDTCMDGRINFARIGFNEEGLAPLAVEAIAGVLTHPSYNGPTSRGNFPANLALVRLERPVNVQPILVNDIRAIPPDNGAAVTFVSSGDTTSTDGSVNFHDKAVSDKIQTSNFNVCSKDYKDRTPSIILEEGVQFCAGVNNKGAGGPCGVGDFGGPLVIKGATSSEDLLVGIGAPPGVGCGSDDPAFVFTRIATYAKWIEEQICFFSAVGPDRCITSSPSTSPSASPTSKPTPAPTPSPTTSPPTPLPTQQPTTGTPTLPPTTPAPTDACSDTSGGVFFVIMDGVSTLETCSWLDENPESVPTSCAPESSTNAGTLCPFSCGLCTRTPTSAPVGPSSSPVTSAPITASPTSSCFDDPDGTLTIVIEGVNVTEPCSYLSGRPALIPALCDPEHPSGAFEVCLGTCDRCSAAPSVTSSFVPSGSSLPSGTPSLPPVAPTPAPTPAPVTASPVSPAPTDVQECVDFEKQFEISFLGAATSHSCPYLMEVPIMFKDAYCSQDHPSGAFDICPKTCGKCTDALTASPVTSMPIQLETRVPVTTPSPAGVAPALIMPVLIMPATTTTLSPVVECEDKVGEFFFIFNGISSIENCRSLAAKPAAIRVACNDPANSLTNIKSICPKTCDACEK